LNGVGYGWASTITTCNKKESKWFEKTIRNEYNTTSPSTHDKNLPFGHGRQSHNEASIAVLFKYSMCLQLLGVFQLRLVQAEEPWIGCTHPFGQFLHDVLAL